MEIDKQELINYFKTRQFKFTNCNEITDVEVSNNTYNPLDTNFVCTINFNNRLIITIRKDGEKFIVRAAKNSGWLGGIHYMDNEEIFTINEFSFNSIKNGFESNNQLYTLVSLINSSSVDEKIFKGTLNEVKSFANDIGLTHGINEHFINTFKENYYYEIKPNSKYRTYYKILAL